MRVVRGTRGLITLSESISTLGANWPGSRWPAAGQRLGHLMARLSHCRPGVLSHAASQEEFGKKREREKKNTSTSNNHSCLFQGIQVQKYSHFSC